MTDKGQRVEKMVVGVLVCPPSLKRYKIVRCFRIHLGDYCGAAASEGRAHGLVKESDLD